ncbi:MAG: hypothetical protein ACTHLA_02200 [Asticcacaulis sp.]|uniref:hypothetical protein n=1 Tax=Asticcacaulis sp. TaxID=1872648 RepID=UPI003F7BED4B
MRGKLLLLLTALCLSAPAWAHAEGETGDGANPLLAPVKPAVPRRRAKPKAKPTLPAAPIPYTAYTAGKAPAASPAIAKALTPDSTPHSAPSAAPLTPLPPPVAVGEVPAPAPALPQQPLAAPPPPAPQAAASAAQPTAPAEISLKCDTQVTEGKRQVSRGSFYINLFPSPVFPDAQADFKFLFVDPAHKSLIRDSICLDTSCSATVSGAAYYLVNRRTKHGEALRITLDRSNGAFYAEEIDKGMTGGAHLGEQGWCTPQKLPSALF